MIRQTLLTLAVLAATGCADNSARFLIDPPGAGSAMRARVATVELRNVSLPGYASALEIAQQQQDGALRNVPKSVWADDPVRGVTMALARSLDQASTATVATEPWPLEEPAQAQVDVRVERMLARADGVFAFAGQYAVASPDGAIRERLTRFDIAVPMPAADPAAIAAASGKAISELAGQIAQTLAR